MSAICGWESQIVIYLSTPHHWELIKSVGSHGSSSLLFCDEVMIWYFMSASHKVLSALIVILLPNWEISLWFHRYVTGIWNMNSLAEK
jgi:hypothetical protein